MTSIVVGTEGARIEFELEGERDEQWLFGRFRMHVGDQTLGDWEDSVPLRAVANWWASFVEDDVERWDPRLDGLDGRAIFRFLADRLYGATTNAEIIEGLPMFRFEISQLGLSAFDELLVMLVEPPGDRQRLLWGPYPRDGAVDDPAIHEAELPPGTLQSVGREFVRAVRRQCPPVADG